MPIALTRTYRPGDQISRAFGIGTSMPYDMFLVGDGQAQGGGSCYWWIDLVLADGGRIRYNNTDPTRQPGGTCGWANGMTFLHTATPTKFYGSTLVWNWGPYGSCYLGENQNTFGTGCEYVLTQKDGTTLYFPWSYGATSAVQAALKAVQDRNGNFVQARRYGATTTITAAGATVTLSYDGSGRVTQASDTLNRTVTYVYDASGRLWKVTDANQGLTQYTYDSSNRMTQITDPRNITPELCTESKAGASG
jgi:YD repeat-containing protein